MTGRFNSKVLGICCSGTLAVLMMLHAQFVTGQKKTSPARSKGKQTRPVDELTKLREQFVTATNEYKASLEKLRATYEKNVVKAEERLAQSEALFAQGLISKNQLDAEQRAVAEAKDKIAEMNQRISNADTQVAQMLVEADAEKKMARTRVPKGGFVQTASYIRFNGGGLWALSEAWRVQRFFQDAFKKPLPITVFGQGAIHDRWRLDHRNSIDVPLHPDGPEGQSLIGFLRANGIPFLAFRGAIPGTATGPHIHIGRPSHRY
jgi:hypothetical protein